MIFTIGITTYNRREYLEKLQKSLSISDIASCNIRIYDDCSTELSVADLKQLFPHATEIVKRNERLGVDGNMRRMFLDFLNTGDDVLVIMDADMICRPDWLSFTKAYFQHTDGVMSLYNSYLHKPVKKISINGQSFLEKNYFGATGSILHKNIVSEIIAGLPPSDNFDWVWCAFIREKGKRLLVSNESYVQHIGLHGSHCHASFIDFGLNFNPINDINRMILSEFFQEASARRKRQYAQLIAQKKGSRESS